MLGSGPVHLTGSVYQGTCKTGFFNMYVHTHDSSMHIHVKVVFLFTCQLSCGVCTVFNDDASTILLIINIIFSELYLLDDDDDDSDEGMH